MEEKKQLGGKRRGAGRKPVQNKKVQISLYVEGGKIFKFGNEEKMKTYLYSLIDEFGQMGKFPEKVDYAKTPNPVFYDAPKVDNPIHDEPPMFSQPKVSQYDAYYIEIMECNSVGEIEAVVREIKKNTIPDWQKNKLEKIAIEKSKTFDF